MRFLFIASLVSALSKESLRQLPEKLRQERIHKTVLQEVDRMKSRIIHEASHNRSFMNFTLYCLDPNRQYRELQLYNKYTGRVPKGIIRVPHYSIPMEMIGYYVYQRQGSQYRYSTEEEREKETEVIEPRPHCDPKHGYKLYQRSHGLLEDPEPYITLFFRYFNKIFTDIHLEVSSNRSSEGLYDSDCCPLFTVSW